MLRFELLDIQPKKKPHAPVRGVGLKDGWFSEAGLLAATEDQGKSTKAEKGGGGGLGDGLNQLEAV